MITHDIAQGSPEWVALRSRHYTASEAPAMLGLSKYKTRAELLREKSTGITQDVDAETQRRFDAGHAAEAGARPIIEAMLGQELYPVTVTETVAGLPLLASLDGITLDESIIWEHKLVNAGLMVQVRAEDLEPHYWAQLEQQLLITGAQKAVFTCSDGTDENMVSMEYWYRQERRAQLLAGWKQFALDLANYQHVEAKPEAIGQAPDQLPALRIEVTGMVTASNLVEFKATALAVFRGINTDLQTDQDFADAEKAVKFCKDAEERLDAAKAHALSQTASIDELFRAIDAIKDEARTVRLKLDKLVKAEKENRKAEIVMDARKAIEEHIAKLNARIGGVWVPVASTAPFAEAIKGLKSIDSMRDKVATALANAKIAANETADRIEINKNSLTSHDWQMVPDFATLCLKEPYDFNAIVALRASQRKADEDKRIEDERERIRAEEEAKATTKAKAEAEAAEAQRVEADLNEAISLGRITIDEAYPDHLADAGKAIDAANEPIITQAQAAEIKRAAVVEHQDDIGAFLASRDFKDAARIRAILVEYTKFTAERAKRKAA